MSTHIIYDREEAFRSLLLGMRMTPKMYGMTHCGCAWEKRTRKGLSNDRRR